MVNWHTLRALRTVSALSMAFLAFPALAEEQEDERFYARGSLFFAATDTEVRLDDPNQLDRGTEIDFEQDLDFSDRPTLVDVRLGYKVKDNLAVELQFLDLSRSSTAILDRSITVEDQTFDVNAEVTGGFDSTVYIGKLVWRVADWDRGDFSLTLGLHATDFAVSIEGDASIGAQAAQLSQIVREQLAPLPTIGARTRIELAEDLYFVGQGEVFALEVNNVQGRLFDLEAGFVWEFSDNVGIGAAYRHLDYRVDIERDRLLADINYTLSGPSVFLTLEF